MPHFRNFHGAAFDFAPSETTEVSNSKGLLVDFKTIGARVEAQAEADSFVFIEREGPTIPDFDFDITVLAPTSTFPQEATTPTYEEDLTIGVMTDPMAEDAFAL